MTAPPIGGRTLPASASATPPADGGARTRKPSTEEALAAAVRDYMRDLDWTVYSEVMPRPGGARCDLVGRRGALIWAVECKAVLSMALLEQADGWVGAANYVSIAYPPARRRPDRWLSRSCAAAGIGRLSATSERVLEIQPPRLHRRRASYLADALTDDLLHWDAAPGMAGGGYYSPFNATVRAMVEFLSRVNGRGATMREIVAGIRHHYAGDATARSTLPRWISNGAIKSVVRGEDGLYRLARKGASQ